MERARLWVVRVLADDTGRCEKTINNAPPSFPFFLSLFLSLCLCFSFSFRSLGRDDNRISGSLGFSQRRDHIHMRGVESLSRLAAAPHRVGGGGIRSRDSNSVSHKLIF